jgi:tetratricopeptide (TPR) repeat protein
VKLHPKQALLQFLGDRTVVVIEPSTNYRTSIKQFLTNLKVRKMKLVSSVAEARREMLTLQVGFFIVEWGLDGTNGIQFCRSLRQEEARKDTPFLLLSTENMRGDVILASEVAIDGYLLKPFSYEDFCEQLFQIVRTRTAPTKLATIIDSAEDALAKGDLEHADKLFAQACDENPGSARALCGLAGVRRQRGDGAAAMRLLKEAARQNPDYVEAYRIMLELCEELEDRAGIVQAATVLNSMSPDNPRYTLILARTFLEMDQLEGSEMFFRKTLSLSPRLAEAYKGLGNVYMMKEEYEKAMKNYKKALDLDQNDIGILNSLGLSYIRMGQVKDGIERYMMALKLDPHDTRVLFNLGQAYEKNGDYERAKWHYAQALIHKPEFDKAVRGLERIERLTGAKTEEQLKEQAAAFIKAGKPPRAG